MLHTVVRLGAVATVVPCGIRASSACSLTSLLGGLTRFRGATKLARLGSFRYHVRSGSTEDTADEGSKRASKQASKQGEAELSCDLRRNYGIRVVVRRRDSMCIRYDDTRLRMYIYDKFLATVRDSGSRLSCRPILRPTSWFCDNSKRACR